MHRNFFWPELRTLPMASFWAKSGIMPLSKKMAADRSVRVESAEPLIELIFTHVAMFFQGAESTKCTHFSIWSGSSPSREKLGKGDASPLQLTCEGMFLVLEDMQTEAQISPFYSKIQVTPP
jgi:hypothetical protein